MTHGNSTYTPELAEEIAILIAEGNSLRQIEALEGKPSKSTMLRWMKDNEEFDTKCARARRVQGELAADEHKDVIDEVRAGTLPVDIARVVLSGLEWRAKKLEPKRYGDKQDVTVRDGGMTKEQRDATVAAALSADR
jgi:hypothetical protein